MTLRSASCECGRVVCESRGEPFVSAVCYCPDCQSAGRIIEAMAAAPAVCETDGGTYLSTFRKGQWACIKGRELLKEVKLRPESPTIRYVTGCCNSAMFLIYTRGFWVSAYRRRFDDALPPLEWRHKIKYRQSELPFADELPRYNGFPAKLFWRILHARFAKI